MIGGELRMPQLFIGCVPDKKNSLYNVFFGEIAGLVRTVVSISHCGCDDPGSIPGLDTKLFFYMLFCLHIHK